MWPPELEAALFEGARVIQASTLNLYMSQVLRIINQTILEKRVYLAAFH